MAVTAIAMFITLGMAIDIGRMFIAKSETQVFVDAASLAAALKLDGTSSGIAAAKTAVATQTNPWNFGTSAVPSPVVTFAATAAGPWSNSPASAAGILYVTVNATVSVPLYFFPAVVPAYTQNVNSVAVAGQISLTSIPQGLAPYTAVSTDNTVPNFGLTIGNLYDLQWPQFNSTRAGCNAANPDKCFVRPACADESAASKVAVVNFWASSNNGYWGSSSNSLIRDEVLDLIQLQPIAVGANIDPVLSNGNKASEAVYLDDRVNQDSSVNTNTVPDYMGDANHNNRRLLPVPIVDPTSTLNTTVIGYGAFLLLSNGGVTSNYYVKNNNGNDPFCAIYAGPYNIAGMVGVGGTTGATVVRLVQ